MPKPQGKRATDFVVRFWSHVRKGDACWEWTGPRKKFGYGRVSTGPRLNGDVRKHRVDAHRIMWMLMFGDPGELWVLHTCDNPPCVRPDHLRLGTSQDNVDDMVRKGRRVKRGPDKKKRKARNVSRNPQTACTGIP